MKSHCFYKYLPLFLPLALLFAGCAILQTAVEVPEMKLASEMPAHARQVADAVVMRLYHLDEKAVAARTGVVGGNHIDGERGFDYAGFRARQVKFKDHINMAYESHRHQVLGYIDMADDAGRSAALSFAVDYTVKGGRTAIVDGAVLPLFSDTPAVELFVVPLSRLNGFPESTINDYRRFYTAVTAAALPLRNPAGVPAGSRDYAIVLFTKDRIAPDRELEFWPSHTEERVDGKIVGDMASTGYRFYDAGWQVGLIPATFSPSGGEALWVKAVMNEEGLGGGKSIRQVGLFPCLATAPPVGEPVPAGHPSSAINKASLPEVRVVAQQQ